MSETLMMWLIGGIGSMLWIELRGIRGSIEKLSVNDENHRTRLNNIEVILGNRPCITDTKHKCKD